MSDNLRDRIAAALGNVDVVLDGWDYLNDTSKFLLADAVMEVITVHVPPILASAIHAYADSELAGLNYHGGSKDAFEGMEKLNREAAQIANYATTHERWNGGKPA